MPGWYYPLFTLQLSIQRTWTCYQPRHTWLSKFVTPSNFDTKLEKPIPFTYLKLRFVLSVHMWGVTPFRWGLILSILGVLFQIPRDEVFYAQIKINILKFCEVLLSKWLNWQNLWAVVWVDWLMCGSVGAGGMPVCTRGALYLGELSSGSQSSAVSRQSQQVASHQS